MDSRQAPAALSAAPAGPAASAVPAACAGRAEGLGAAQHTDGGMPPPWEPALAASPTTAARVCVHVLTCVGVCVHVCACLWVCVNAFVLVSEGTWYSQKNCLA